MDITILKKHKKPIIISICIIVLYLVCFFICKFAKLNSYIANWSSIYSIWIAIVLSIIPLFFKCNKLPVISLVGYILSIIIGHIIDNSLGLYVTKNNVQMHSGSIMFAIVFAFVYLAGITVELFIIKDKMSRESDDKILKSEGIN